MSLIGAWILNNLLNEVMNASGDSGKKSRVLRDVDTPEQRIALRAAKKSWLNKGTISDKDLLNKAIEKFSRTFEENIIATTHLVESSLNKKLISNEELLVATIIDVSGKLPNRIKSLDEAIGTWLNKSLINNEEAIANIINKRDISGNDTSATLKEVGKVALEWKEENLISDSRLFAAAVSVLKTGDTEKGNIAPAAETIKDWIKTDFIKDPKIFASMLEDRTMEVEKINSASDATKIWLNKSLIPDEKELADAVKYNNLKLSSASITALVEAGINADKIQSHADLYKNLNEISKYKNDEINAVTELVKAGINSDNIKDDFTLLKTLRHAIANPGENIQAITDAVKGGFDKNLINNEEIYTNLFQKIVKESPEDIKAITSAMQGWLNKDIIKDETLLLKTAESLLNKTSEQINNIGEAVKDWLNKKLFKDETLISDLVVKMVKYSPEDLKIVGDATKACHNQQYVTDEKLLAKMLLNAGSIPTMQDAMNSWLNKDLISDKELLNKTIETVSNMNSDQARLIGNVVKNWLNKSLVADEKLLTDAIDTFTDKVASKFVEGWTTRRRGNPSVHYNKKPETFDVTHALGEMVKSGVNKDNIKDEKGIIDVLSHYSDCYAEKIYTVADNIKTLTTGLKDDSQRIEALKLLAYPDVNKITDLAKFFTVSKDGLEGDKKVELIKTYIENEEKSVAYIKAAISPDTNITGIMPPAKSQRSPDIKSV